MIKTKKVRSPYKGPFYISLILAVVFISILATTSVAGAVSSPVKIKVEVNLLNLRMGPSTAHTRIQGLPSGTPLEVLFREREWLLVRLKDGSTGWVDGKYTSFNKNMADKLPPVIGEKATVTVSLLNVRLGPDLNYQRINQLHQDNTITVYFHEGDWLLARLADGTSGWVYRQYTSFAPKAPDANPQTPDTNTEKESQPAEKSEQIVPQQQTPVKEVEQYPYKVIVTSSPLRLREQPGLNNAPVGEIPKETILTVLHKTKEEWLQVELPDGRQGWVAGWYTQKLEGNEERGEEKADTFFRLAAVNADVLRVRSGPGLQYPQIGRVFSGNHLLTLHEQNGWYYVRTPSGEYGWISSEYAAIINVVSRGTSSAQPVNPSQSKNITVVIDPGHGGQDNGATGFSGLKEKNVNLTVSLYMADLLQARGFNVVMTRKNDLNMSLAERVALAERINADLFISIHANASPNNKFASGTETFYYQNKEASPQSFYLASLIQQEVSAALKLPSLGVKKAPFHVIRETSMPSALVELAFLTNAVDETILGSDHCLKLAAQALYRAVLRYYNLTS
jgi:N-acetylmuramoyl-L-alanine amidase